MRGDEVGAADGGDGATELAACLGRRGSARAAPRPSPNEAARFMTFEIATNDAAGGDGRASSESD